MGSNQRKKIRFFLSYAHKNMQLARSFKDLLLEQMGPSKTYKYSIWHDEDDLLVGKDWDKEIKSALKACDLGLLLLSPSFLNSKYISENELPLFVGEEAKPCIPVLLSPVNFRRHDLKGLRASQIYRYNTSRISNRNFNDCTSQQRGKFCEKLFDKIEQRLDDLMK